MEKPTAIVSGWMFTLLGLQPRPSPPCSPRTTISSRGAIPTPCALYDYLDAPLRPGPELQSVAPSAEDNPSTKSAERRSNFFRHATEPGTIIDLFVPTMLHHGAVVTTDVVPDWRELSQVFHRTAFAKN